VVRKDGLYVGGGGDRLEKSNGIMLSTLKRSDEGEHLVAAVEGTPPPWKEEEGGKESRRYPDRFDTLTGRLHCPPRGSSTVHPL
jgi:hypothetical protein